MYPTRFDYVRAESIDHVLDLLETHGDEARALAGGQSLIPLMKLRLVSPQVLIDLNGIAGLDYLSESDGWFRIGALTRHATVASSDAVAGSMPLLRDAVRVVGDVQVRNRGTVVGALMEADPAGDWGPAFIAQGGEALCTSRRGERVIHGAELFADILTPSVGQDELVTEVRFRRPGPGAGGAYVKLERRVGDFAVVGAAVQLSLDAQGVCRQVGVGLSGVGRTPVHAREAEEALCGTTLGEAALRDAMDRVDRAIDPMSDTRASAEYKRDALGAVFRHALELARQRAGSPSEPRVAARNGSRHSIPTGSDGRSER